MPKDFFEVGSDLVFIVDKMQVGIALGKGGANIKRLRELMDKRIKVVGAGKDAKELITNFIFPLKPKNIVQEDATINIEFNTGSERRALLGNQQSRLKLLKETVKRYFPEIKEIRIL